jgi:hypothetical protein
VPVLIQTIIPLTLCPGRLGSLVEKLLKTWAPKQTACYQGSTGIWEERRLGEGSECVCVCVCVCWREPSNYEEHNFGSP